VPTPPECIRERHLPLRIGGILDEKVDLNGVAPVMAVIEIVEGRLRSIYV
jgi:hypothetical protein